MFLPGVDENITRLREFFALGVPVDAVVNPLISPFRLQDVLTEAGVDCASACTLVVNGFWNEKDPAPGGITYQLPIAEYVAIAVRRIQQLMADKKLPPEQIPVHVPIRKNAL